VRVNPLALSVTIDGLAVAHREVIRSGSGPQEHEHRARDVDAPPI
jgi:hypothetical protein